MAGFLIGAQPVPPLRSLAPLAVTEAARPSDLMSALRVAQVIEVYRIDPGISFQAAPTPDVVRDVGCRYFVRRAHYLGDSPEWRDLEQSLAKADLRFTPATERTELRLGLVLGDWRGTLWEIYLSDLPDVHGKVGGVEQRRSVKASASVVEALKGFIARHTELITTNPNGAYSPRCPPRP